MGVEVVPTERLEALSVEVPEVEDLEGVTRVEVVKMVVVDLEVVVEMEVGTEDVLEVVEV